MGYDCFDVDIADKVAHVRLNRGDELNTMTPAFWRERLLGRRPHRRR
jgi:enoyl-CoA hydratase